jgi:hypothetical protein
MTSLSNKHAGTDMGGTTCSEQVSAAASKANGSRISMESAPN